MMQKNLRHLMKMGERKPQALRYVRRDIRRDGRWDGRRSADNRLQKCSLLERNLLFSIH
ncbi:hypothetical protein [Paenibacillus sp. J2TS4]|uniref:hypothetical protein n=1 Tax=Paenibacillus sp. J2TS4 TaxID=2807194 RepID=UPI001B21148E|nr:hypothetical protein [Paenibacillus sp. J2TS4]GIP34545.1 hypothetical protein J2TS4_37550 [Paenibacillus sp. J2TS4]